MKRYLYEEEYNQIVKICSITDVKKIKKLKQRLDLMGIDSFIKNNEFYISVEQDRNDPHYVDDIVNIARREYAKLDNDNLFHSFKLAENELKWVCHECVKKIMENSVINDALFGIVKGQAKKAARKKIMQYFQTKKEGAKPTPKTRFEQTIFNICDSNHYANEREISQRINNAIDELMNNECRIPDLSEYEMFSIISKELINYI